MSERKHTETPWKANHNEIYRNGNIVAMCPKYGCSMITGGEMAPWHNAEQNAAHIVKCVNMWEEGITVMEAALKALTAASETNIGKWHYEAERLVRDFLTKAGE